MSALPVSETNKAQEMSLLTPNRDNKDDDASSLRSVSEQDTDSEDDVVLHGAQSSLEIALHDRSVLEEEEEREKLLAADAPGTGLRRIFSTGSGQAPKVKIGKKERRRRRRQERRELRRHRRASKDGLLSSKSGDGELLYEMEEGGLKSETSSVSSGSSVELDRRKFRHLRGSNESRISRYCHLTLIATAVSVLFVVLLLAAYRASVHSHTKQSKAHLSNGTSVFAPTTIVLSLDGFRADFLQRGLTPTLKSLIEKGTSPQHMLPSFPSVTFPNHYTLMTGLYPESHGVVGNTFWDPSLKASFYYTDPARSLQPKWWQAEPLWVTAESQGVRTAVHMWPGSEAHIGDFEPSFLDKYNGTEKLSKKVDRVLELLDLPGPHDGTVPSEENTRPQLIAAYVPVVDADGHLYGPNSSQILSTIKGVDGMLHDLLDGLDERNLTDVVNLIVVSDHGMASTSVERLIQLEDLIDPEIIEHTDGWPLYGLRLKDSSGYESAYEKLRANVDNGKTFDVFLRDKNMPVRYHFTANERIAPLWIVPKTGWAIVTKDEFNVEEGLKMGKIYHPRGLHGYDHEHPLMRAIFVARGPAFPHKPNSRLQPFQNTEVYNLICDSLGVEPMPNNGSLRLPLKPTGLHSDDDVHPDVIPPDPVVDPSSSKLSSTPVSSTGTITSASNPAATRAPENQSGDPTNDENTKTVQDFRKYAAEVLRKFKGWLHKVLGGN